MFSHERIHDRTAAERLEAECAALERELQTATDTRQLAAVGWLLAAKRTLLVRAKIDGN